MAKEEMMKVVTKELRGELSQTAKMQIGTADIENYVTGEFAARVTNCLFLIAKRLDEVEASLPPQER